MALVATAPPRMRTSMIMQVIRALGVPVLGEFLETEMNPGGNGEHPLSTVGIDTATLPSDAAIKLLIDAFLFRSKIHDADKVIFCLREPSGMDVSQGKWSVWKPTSPLRRWNYARFLRQFQAWMAKTRCPVLVVDTDAMVHEPRPWVERIAAFADVPFHQAGVDAVRLGSVRIDTIEDEAMDAYREMKCFAIT